MAQRCRSVIFNARSRALDLVSRRPMPAVRLTAALDEGRNALGAAERMAHGSSAGRRR